MNRSEDKTGPGHSTDDPGQNDSRRRIAYFVSAHGFGHAARAAAVMEAVARSDPNVHFDIFTTVPAWFFRDSLRTAFNYYEVETDVGFAQRSPFEQNAEATINRLDRFLPFDHQRIDALARRIHAQNCGLAISDISPLGITVGRLAGIPTVLIENFTWDWLYEGDAALASRVKPHIDYLRRAFQSADVHIQTEPVCAYDDKAIIVGPVSRRPRLQRTEVRRRLGIPADKKMVLITTGGVPDRCDYREISRQPGDAVLVVPGGAARVEHRDNLILLPAHSEHFHPDLVAASDAVVGKVGYSTLAEVFAAGVPFGYILRPDFRESRPLGDFIRRHMQGRAIDIDRFYLGDWLADLPELLALPRREPQEAHGARQIADILK